MTNPYKNAVETTHELPWLFNMGPLTAYAPPRYSTLLGLLAFSMKNTRAPVLTHPTLRSYLTAPSVAQTTHLLVESLLTPSSSPNTRIRFKPLRLCKKSAQTSRGRRHCPHTPI